MTVFNLPDLGEGLPDAEIVQWLVKEGDEVEAGDAMVEMSTAKAVVEVPVPHGGKVMRLHGRPGDVIDTGAALITIAEDGEEAEPGAEEAKPAPKAEAKSKSESKPKKTPASKPAKGGTKGHIFNLPDLGEGLPDAEIVQWLVKEGDEVEAGDAMVEMSTAKAVVEVPAPHTGRVVKVYGGPGDVIDTGNPLVVIDTGEGGEEIVEEETQQEEAPAKAAEPKTEKVREDAGTVVGEMIVGEEVTSESRAGADGVIASAAVRALARKMKVDLTSIAGTGPDGEVTLKDVRGAEPGAAPAVKAASTAAAAAAPARGDFKIGPAADLLAKSLGLDPSSIPSANGTTITKQDVLAAARARLEGAPAAAPAARMSGGDASIAAGRRVKAAPKVRAYARDKGVEIGQAAASGPAGNVTMADVDRVMADFRVEAPAAAAVRYALPPRAYEVSGKPEKLVGPRRVMSQMMAKANAEVCHTSIFDEADISSWPKGVDITARLMRSVIAAAMDEPALNAWFDGEEGAKTVHRHVNLGVAVDSPRGLFVPVVQGADSMSPEAMRKELDVLRQAIADGSIQPSQMSGATITLSNYGMLAGRFATPIITPPQVAIVGIGGLHERLVMTEKGIENHRFVPVSVTFDHRACTGGESARYLAGVLKDLESSV